MSELFDDEDKAIVDGENSETEVDAVIVDNEESSISDARRRLENLLDEKRLRSELDDFLDY